MLREIEKTNSIDLNAFWISKSGQAVKQEFALMTGAHQSADRHFKGWRR